MREVSAATSAAMQGLCTTPVYLIEIGWSVVVRLSTASPVSWLGASYLAADVQLTGLDWRNSGEQRGQLMLGNADATWLALALNEGVADVPVQVWQCFSATPGDADPVRVFSGFGDGMEASDKTLTLSLVAASSRVQTAPRRTIGRATGFNFLPPSGQRMSWAGEVYTLERRHA